MRKDDLNKPKDWDEACQKGGDPVAEADKVRATTACKAPKWRKRIVTAADLRTMEFPEVSYVLPGIIPEGLTLMGGRPKIGKSWMALDLCIGIASGRPVLGDIEPVTGSVLYCALEDTQRRLKKRITKILSPFTEEWPEQLALEHFRPPLNQNTGLRI